jgi:hypothetical protein
MGGLSRAATVVLLVAGAIVATSAPARTADQVHAAGWALDRLDQFVREPEDRAFRYQDALSGDGVTIYVLSAGTFDGADADLAGRTVAPLGFGGAGNAGDTLDPDCRDTGAEAAGLGSLAAGSTYGVAKKARVRFLQIADCETRIEQECVAPFCRYRQTTHTTVHHADVIEAVDWVTDHGDRPAVAMLNYAVVDSTGFLDAPLTRSMDSGVTWVVPAGDTPRAACDHTPAWLGDSRDGVITVGATDQNDASVAGGGYGPCVDIFAPGLGVPSLVPVGGPTAAAAAFTAGVIAQYLDVASTWTPAALEQHLKEQATAGVVRGLKPDSPNLLLHSAWWGPVLRLTCASIATTPTWGRFRCDATDLNGPSTGHRWRRDNEHRAGGDDQPSITGTCAVGRLYSFQVGASRYGHADVASFTGMPCRLTP